VNSVDIDAVACSNVIAGYINAANGDPEPDPAKARHPRIDHYNDWRSIMKPRKTLVVKGTVTTGALVLAFLALPALAEQSDGHAFVRDSIRNTWTPTAVASPTAGKTDPHERGRITIVGTAKSSAERVTSTNAGPRVGGHEQARRLLLAQPVVATEGARSGS
jgi:hypothetical protein